MGWPTRAWVLAWMLGALASFEGTTALADEVDPETPAESRAAAFRAVRGGQGEDVPGGPLLVAAYGAVLALVLGYVVYLGRLSAGASLELDRLERELAARRSNDDGTPTSTSGPASGDS